MFCAKCGNQLPEGAAFCGKCGTPVGVVKAAPEEGPPGGGPPQKVPERQEIRIPVTVPKGRAILIGAAVIFGLIALITGAVAGRASALLIVSVVFQGFWMMTIPALLYLLSRRESGH